MTSETPNLHVSKNLNISRTKQDIEKLKTPLRLVWKCSVVFKIGSKNFLLQWHFNLKDQGQRSNFFSWNLFHILGRLFLYFGRYSFIKKTILHFCKYIYVIYRMGGPYWKNILSRSQKRPKAEGRF